MEQGLNVLRFKAESLESLFASQGIERRVKTKTVSDLMLFETRYEEHEKQELRRRNNFDLAEVFPNLNSYKFTKRGCEIVYGVVHPRIDIDTIDYDPPCTGGDGSCGSTPMISTTEKSYKSG